MRTRDRLISVCKSLNPATVGRANVEAMKMAAGAAAQIPGIRHLLLADEVALIAHGHPSPHVRELAAELLALK